MFLESFNLSDDEPFPRAYDMAFGMSQASIVSPDGQLRFTLDSFLRILEGPAALAAEDRDAAASYICSIFCLTDEGRVAEIVDDLPRVVSILRAMSEEERNDVRLIDDDRVEELAGIAGSPASSVHKVLAEFRKAEAAIGRGYQLLRSRQLGHHNQSDPPKP